MHRLGNSRLHDRHLGRKTAQAKPSRIASAALIVAGFSLFVGAGCGTFKSLSMRSTVPEAWSVKTPGGTSVSSMGGAETPAKLTDTRSVSTLPVPVGSTVALATAPTAEKPSGTPAVVTLSAPSELRVESSATVAESPRSFAPPAPPTPSAVATGVGVRLFYWLAVGFAVCAVACFYFAHAKAGVICALAAGGLPLLASVSVWLAEHAAVAAGVGALTLVVAWYLVTKNRLSAKNDEKGTGAQSVSVAGT